jgi:hypothetical protein
MRGLCALHHFSLNTEKTYVHWLGRDARFLRDSTLKELPSERKPEAFLTGLAKSEGRSYSLLLTAVPNLKSCVLLSCEHGEKNS